MAPRLGDSRFRVSLLGAFALERDGVPIDTGLWQRRVSSLLTLLATAPNHRCRRDDVIEALWPEASQERGGRNLRTLAYRLRAALGGGDPPPVLADHGWVGLHPAYTWDIDLARFEDLAQGDRDDVVCLEAALALHRGEPLVEERYEDWAVPIRERVQAVWRGVCLRLSDRCQEKGLLEAALDILRAVLEADPLDEEAMQRLLTALHRAGRPAEALRRCHAFERRLRDQIGVPPAVETMHVISQLHAPPAALAPHPGRRFGGVRSARAGTRPRKAPWSGERTRNEASHVQGRSESSDLVRWSWFAGSKASTRPDGRATSCCRRGTRGSL
jgi:DNA-binding SARP family transcriptional activator